MYATLADTESFKTIIAALRTVNSAANAYFSQEGLIVQVLSETNALCITARFTRDAFSLYKCDADESFWFSLKFFAAALKLVPRDGTITLQPGEKGKIEIHYVTSGPSVNSGAFCLSTSQADREYIDSSIIQHPAEFTTSASFFSRSEILHQASEVAVACSFGPLILPDSPPGLVISCVGKDEVSVVSCRTSISPKVVTMTLPEGGVGVDTSINYPLTELKRLAPIAADNRGKVRVCFGSDAPLLVSFMMNSGCVVQYAIAPSPWDENVQPGGENL
jgi:hypothetical protein